MSEERKEKQNKALEHLHTKVAETINSESWKAALSFRRRLQHPYSITNLLLIWSQCPDAQMVAGFHKWKSVGRQVRKGEKGIMILAPLTRKREDDSGNEERFVSGFRTAYVFDVKQTDGKDVPMFPDPPLLEGHEDIAAEALKLLEGYALKRGWKLQEKVFDNGALGSWTPATGTIAVDPTMSPLQRAKTLAHEVAHAHANHTTESRQTAELEAETAAFLVMDALGADTTEYTFLYLSHWSKEEVSLDLLLEAGRRATKIADEILASITSTTAATVAAA